MILLGAFNSQAEDEMGARLKNLTAAVIKAASPESGISQEVQELATKFEELDHAKAVESMIPLLKHEKKGVPDLASYVILSCEDGLRPEHLDQLKEGFRNGGGWLPHAIGSLGTAEAAEFLAKEFRANPHIHGQVDSALIRMGERAVPFLLKEFDDADPKREPRFFEGLRHVFRGDHDGGGMKDKAAIAIPSLMKTAEFQHADLLRRQEAIRTIGCIGKAATAYFPRLRELAQKEPGKFGEAVEQAFLASGTSFSSEILVKIVEREADPFTVREIAHLGTVAKDVGPQVLRWLDHPNWEIRVISARTLGCIGYKDGVKEIERLLSSETDWRLAYVAAKSLADLRAVESIPALEEASQKHWFPIVRDAARNALNDLRQKDGVEGRETKLGSNPMDYVFVDREKLSIEEDVLKDFKPRKVSAGRRIGFDEFMEREPAIAKRFVEVRNTTGEKMLEFWGSLIEFPMAEGVLLGATAGEWVGGLHFANGKGDHRRLVNENIIGIESWKSHVYVASGTYHMGGNMGTIHKVLLKEGKVDVVPWFILPGSPRDTWVTEDEKLVVACYGGTIAFSEEGEFEYFSSERLKRTNSGLDGVEQPISSPDMRTKDNSEPQKEM